MTMEENSSSVNGSRASNLGSWVGNSVAFPALHKGYNSTAKKHDEQKDIRCVTAAGIEPRPSGYGWQG
jgi:hypothetical protein